MKTRTTCKCSVIRILGAALVALTLAAELPAQGDGARAYWKSLAGTNAITFWPTLATGNVNPLDPSQFVSPDSSFEAQVAIMGAHKVLPVQVAAAAVFYA